MRLNKLVARIGLLISKNDSASEACLAKLEQVLEQLENNQQGQESSKKDLPDHSDLEMGSMLSYNCAISHQPKRPCELDFELRG